MNDKQSLIKRIDALAVSGELAKLPMEARQIISEAHDCLSPAPPQTAQVPEVECAQCHERLTVAEYLKRGPDDCDEGYRLLAPERMVPASKLQQALRSWQAESEAENNAVGKLDAADRFISSVIEMAANASPIPAVEPEGKRQRLIAGLREIGKLSDEDFTKFVHLDDLDFSISVLEKIIAASGVHCAQERQS